MNLLKKNKRLFEPTPELINLEYLDNSESFKQILETLGAFVKENREYDWSMDASQRNFRILETSSMKEVKNPAKLEEAEKK